MKRTERHRLKENELSHVLGEASARLTQNRRTYGLAIAVVLVILAVAGGYWAWHTRSESRAQVMLGEAITIVQSPVEAPKPGSGGPPQQAPGTYPTIQARAETALAKFTEAANAYPSTKAGIAARYYAASALTVLGKPAEAVTGYQEVIDRAGADSFYGRMAQLGVIESGVLAKQFDQAITTAEALVNNPADDTIPRDALLMELGRVYAAAGKKVEAKQTFDKVIAEFPDSVYIDEAKLLLSTLT
jgi:tetratricopeptide (TPR) repeat protein